ncbi:MAG: hypothetical protein JO329_04060 [Planctomycetaceae bacterium]|nr:hypothetical protein [Planctomycetaceae bacterium]MBV8265988.1 hypothetical protein [Planctomycetaceae bacterium]MBV8316970.1 hypothetical protein [Planctomycetaceae bacterium]
MLELLLACDLPQRLEHFVPDRSARRRIATGWYRHGRMAVRGRAASARWSAPDRGGRGGTRRPFCANL